MTLYRCGNIFSKKAEGRKNNFPFVFNDFLLTRENGCDPQPMKN
jgi:hypothetical protein